MKIDIEIRTVVVPIKIEIDGKSYPITQYNRNIVEEYWATEKESVLGKLKDFSLDI